MYEIFEHTADLGIRVRAGDLESLFEEAGRAFLALIIADPRTVEVRESADIRVSGDNSDYLFVDWLNELLFLFESRRFLAGSFRVVVQPTGLEAHVGGEPYDARRHVLVREVKAVTYHALRVIQEKDGWLAEVILDI